MIKYMNYNILLIKDFKRHSQELSHRLRDHGKAMVVLCGRPCFSRRKASPTRKTGREKKAVMNGDYRDLRQLTSIETYDVE